MDIKEWEKLREENPEQYKKEYCKFMYDENNTGKCNECPHGDDKDHSKYPFNYPCGQQNCWVTCHCNSKD